MITYILMFLLNFSYAEEEFYSFTSGHQNLETFELIYGAKKNKYRLHRLEDARLVNSLALTKTHYERIKKDWLAVFSSIEPITEPCTELIRLYQELNKKRDSINICFSDWSDSHQKKYLIFHKRLKDFAIGNEPIY